jgi:signal transduction histidine kinase
MEKIITLLMDKYFTTEYVKTLDHEYGEISAIYNYDDNYIQLKDKTTRTDEETETLNDGQRKMGQFGKKFDKIAKPLEFLINIIKTENIEIPQNFQEIIKDIQADLPKIYASNTEINQVILNLVKVCCQSMMAHSKKQIIKIKLSSANSKVKLELSDNGPGLDEETQKKIFEPFFTSKNIGEGVSMGLSVSYKIIVDSHKGDLTISSEENGGTTFTIMLPVATV